MFELSSRSRCIPEYNFRYESQYRIEAMVVMKTPSVVEGSMPDTSELRFSLDHVEYLHCIDPTFPSHQISNQSQIHVIEDGYRYLHRRHNPLMARLRHRYTAVKQAIATSSVVETLADYQRPRCMSYHSRRNDYLINLTYIPRMRSLSSSPPTTLPSISSASAPSTAMLP